MNVLKIDGLYVHFSDGEIKKKDRNNLWLYEIHFLTPWENRRWMKTENGQLELVFEP